MTMTETTSAKPSPQANGKPRAEIAVQLQQMRPQFAAALPAHITADKFERVVLTAVALNSELLAADRKSLFLACNKAAQDGLLPDGREGAIVVFGGKAAWLPMVGGIIKKMRQSGELSTLSANVVYENDQFSYVLGDDERIDHRPLLVGDRGKAILAYAIAKLKDGGVQREVMTLADIERARKTSRAPNSLMWKDFWGEGARKTVIKRLAKYLPLSAEDQRTLARDETEFEVQKRDALLAKAGEQIGAITHHPIEEGEQVDAIDGEIVDAAEDTRTAAVRLRDQLVAQLAEIEVDAQITQYVADVADQAQSLHGDLRASFEAAVAARREAVKGKKK